MALYVATSSRKQGGFKYLDSAPLSISAKNHRPVYASDGDYFSKPSVDDVVEKVYLLFHRSKSNKFPKF